MRKNESARDGQKVRTETSPDKSSHKIKDGLGGKFGGGPTDVSHSLSGAGKANVDYQKK